MVNKKTFQALDVVDSKQAETAHAIPRLRQNDYSWFHGATLRCLATVGAER